MDTKELRKTEQTLSLPAMAPDSYHCGLYMPLTVQPSERASSLRFPFSSIILCSQFGSTRFNCTPYYMPNPALSPRVAENGYLILAWDELTVQGRS